MILNLQSAKKSRISVIGTFALATKGIVPHRSAPEVRAQYWKARRFLWARLKRLTREEMRRTLETWPTTHRRSCD